MQDRWVLGVLHQKRNGWFVDAGAGPDGIVNSNTYALEAQLGWTGLCVEPHPARYPQVKANRRCITENVCLTENEQDVVFVLNDAAPGTSGVVDMLSESIKAWSYSADRDYQTVVLKGVPLATLLRNHDAPSVIDYLSLDIEGGEWAVLSSFPFDEYTFRCMSIERCSDHCVRLRRLLKSRGYRLVGMTGADDLWVHRSLGHRAAPAVRVRTAVAEVAQLVKHGWLGL